MMKRFKVNIFKSVTLLITILLVANCSEDKPFEVEDTNLSIFIFYPKDGFKVSGISTVSVNIISNSTVDSVSYKIDNVEEIIFDDKKESTAFDFGDTSKYEHGQQYTLIVKWWGSEGIFSDSSLFIVESDITERITSVGNSFALFNSVPTYSSDSTRIIAQSLRTGNMDLYLIIFPWIGIPDDEIRFGEGSTQEDDLNLSNSPSSEIMPYYWAVNDQLLYSSNTEGNYRLYLLDLATGGVDTLTVDTVDAFFPSGDHSGSLIAYERDEEGNSDIWLLNLTDKSRNPLLQREGSDGHPLFSPDDVTIIFHSNFNGTFDIWTIPAEGGDPALIVDWASDEKNPVWSPDGNFIAFTSNRAGNDDVWLYRLSDGSAVQLTSNSVDEDFAVFHSSKPEILFSAFIDDNYDIFRLTNIYNSF